MFNPAIIAVDVLIRLYVLSGKYSMLSPRCSHGFDRARLHLQSAGKASCTQTISNLVIFSSFFMTMAFWSLRQIKNTDAIMICIHWMPLYQPPWPYSLVLVSFSVEFSRCFLWHFLCHYRSRISSLSFLSLPPLLDPQPSLKRFSVFSSLSFRNLCVLLCVVVWCRMLQYVAVCCSVLQCVLQRVWSDVCCYWEPLCLFFSEIYISVYVCVCVCVFLCVCTYIHK